MLTRTLTLDDPEWDVALARMPHDVYHTADYVRIDAHRQQAAGEAILISDGERHFFLPYLVRPCKGLFPGAGEGLCDIASPYGYPGLLLNEYGRDPGFAAAAWSAMCEQWRSRGACSAFLRMHPIFGAGFDALLPQDALTDSGETVGADLSLDEDALWRNVAEKHRHTIKRAARHGFAARDASLLDVLDAFIEVYRQTMDRVRAKDSYYFSREYFAALASMRQTHCCIVEKDDEIAAACLLFETCGVVQLHLGGTATAHYSYSPFTMCLYRAMVWASQRGNHRMHFGGGLGGNNDQLFKFKARFGPLRYRFHTARIVLDEQRYNDLVERAALHAGIPVADLQSSTFFPAYRATL
jgi:CelD/BcsL family acetyltransferase involved in cellulose biosynthesis